MSVVKFDGYILVLHQCYGNNPARNGRKKVYQEVMHSLDIRYDSEGLVFGVWMASKISVVPTGS